MARYFSPDLPGSEISRVSSSGGISEKGSWSNSQDHLYESIEQLRGSPASRPAHLFRQPPAEYLEDPVEEIPSRFDVVRRQQVPIEERRKIPGCGINEFDLFDNPVRAETDPIDPEFFQPAPKAYGRQPNRRHRHPPSVRFGTAANLFGTQPQQPESSSIPTYVGAAAALQQSPTSSSSSSSYAASPPPAYEDFQPGFQSSLLCTPPHQRYPIREKEVAEHPAYVPSYNVYPPENYYPSPPSAYPPSDQSEFERTPTPERNRGASRVVRQVEQVFEDMFPTYSREGEQNDGDESGRGFGFGVHTI